MSEAADRKWWLSRSGQVDGPFGTAYVFAGVQTGTIPLGTPVCPVGGAEWKTLGDWPEFEEMVDAGDAPPPPPGGFAGLRSRLAWNPALPPMANAVCLYALFVAPASWLLFVASDLLLGHTITIADTSRLSAAENQLRAFIWKWYLTTAVVLFMGGWMLRRLRRAGPTVLLVGLWAGLGLELATDLVAFGIGLFVDPSDRIESTMTRSIFLIPLVVVFVAERIFEIASLVWLHCNAKRIPFVPEDPPPVQGS